MVVAKSWTMVKHFDGAPKPEDFKLVEKDLPALKDGGPYIQLYIMFKQIQMEGFLLSLWEDRYEEGQKQLLQWVLEGKLKYHEHITNGFENMTAGFMGMLKGENPGKAIIKV
ncbi:prostaglandin reductase 1-like [Aquarana catesbeiana]|uniref:prostaglandin reductase 1-like n=1 Tax=Aquarana catesbeiana TaxID=8400 RepID=UPI003CC9815F